MNGDTDPPGPDARRPRRSSSARSLVSLLSMVMEWVLDIDGTPIFVVSAAGILGLAYVVGISTERLGGLAGPQVGGILNATFGNIAELIIAFFALTAGKMDVVKASLDGLHHRQPAAGPGRQHCSSAASAHGIQRFSAKIAGMDATMLVLAVIGLFVPAVFALSPRPAGTERPPGRGERGRRDRAPRAVLRQPASTASSTPRRCWVARSRRATPGPPGRPRSPWPCWVSRPPSWRCCRSSWSAPSTRSSSSST